jgi:hypothetical protein
LSSIPINPDTHPQVASNGEISLNGSIVGQVSPNSDGTFGYTLVNGTAGTIGNSGGLLNDIRLPDFIAANISIAIPNPITGTVIGWSGTASIDRYGDWYYSPLGIGAGKSATIVSGSLTVNWMDQLTTPSQSLLNNMLSTNGFNASAGYIGGVSESYTPGAGYSTGVGLFSPQAGASYNYSFHGGNVGWQW